MGNIIRPKETWKTDIIKPDEHLASYIYQKQTDPDTKIMLRAYQKQVVDTVDHIVELAHGERDVVKGEKDWVIVEELLKFWARQWPDEYNEFKSTVADLRATRNEGGMSQSKEMKYVGALPSQRFMKMIKAIFPAQQWDKTFTNKFVNRFPLFKVGDRIDPKYR